ncbi:MAG: glycoside hydrolase, partial [Planctomycetota bacterium]
MTALLPGSVKFPLSKGSLNPGPTSNMQKTTSQAQWLIDSAGIQVNVELSQKALSVRFSSDTAGSFTWPVVQQTPLSKALIWPRWEGCYIPLDNDRWKDYLTEHGEWNTLEGLSMPFWGLDYGNFSLTYIITNPYNNEIQFQQHGDGLRFKFTHEFTSLALIKDFGFLIRLGNNSSPVEPARQFRQWLIEQGKFVSMNKKIKKAPNVERLLGAPHVYLWGDAPFSRHDIPRARWRPFGKKLIEQASAPGASPGKKIKQLMTPEHWSEVVEIASTQWSSQYLKSQVANELSRLLVTKNFYNEDSWRGIILPDEAVRLLKNDPDTLSSAELCRMNSLVLHAAYGQLMLPHEQWGDGVSIKMLNKFKESGFDRMRFCIDGWEGIEKRPFIAKQANRMGYLFGTYDSYHSIHDPSKRGTDSTWTTAQFDTELFETGPIVRIDGKKRGGFKGAGYKLSPIAARSYVEKRVRENMKNVPYNYYFVDCDAYGEVYDDYSPLHRISQAEDAQERIDRMAWISDTFGLVIGSEGGSSFAAGVIHVAEGMFGPIFGWNDPDMRNRDSEYYLGQYYPPDGPKVFVKQVPMKERYQYLYYDPRFRLPLYEIVFHDSVVTTHQWANSSLKYSNVLDTVALTELLYMVPPLYHMNL